MGDRIPIKSMRGWRVCPACVAAMRAADLTWAGECPRCEWSPMLTLSGIRSDRSRWLWNDVNLPGFLRAIEAGEFPVMEVKTDDER